MKQLFVLIMILATSKTEAQNYFQVEKDYPDGSNGRYTKELKTLQTYSDEEVNSVFAKVLESGIFFNYPQGGCQNRAEMMHILLEKKLKIDHAKIWIFAPTDLYPNDDRHLEIEDKNGYAKNNTITWKYHVAPTVLRRNPNGQTDTLVIDPSIDNKKPMILRDWLSSMKNSSLSKYTFLDSKWYFFYTKPNSSVINGFFYPYESHWVEDFHRSTVERGLAANDLAKFLMQKLKDGYDDTDGNVKNLLANQDNMYNFFMNPYSTFPGRANLLANHSDLMRISEQFYWEQVAYWQKEINTLLKLD